MKKAIAILIILVMLALCGCEGKTTVNSDNLREEGMFVIIEEEYLWEVVYHRDTKVMYVVSRGYSNSGDFHALVNPDGTPMLWEGGGGDG